MDHEDPEKRITELERQSAERQRSAGLPPAGPEAAASGRFTGYKWAKPRANVINPRTYITPDPLRPFVICVTTHGLTIDLCPGEVFAFRDAQLGLWVRGSMTLGTALHLQSGPHRFVLGGRDHRVATNPTLEAAPVDDRVDGWMWAADFSELLTGMASRSSSEVRGAAPGQPTRCWLVSTSALRAAAFSWLYTRKVDLSLAIDLGEDAIWVMDVNTNALVASGWLAQVTATPTKRAVRVTAPGGYGTQAATLPILVVCVPGVDPLSIGCLDRGIKGPQYSYYSHGHYRFSWHGAVPEDNEPGFWASGADWLTLVDRFGLSPSLEGQR